MGHPTRTELEPSSSQSPNARHSAASRGAPAQGRCWRAGKEPPAASAQGAGLSLRTARTGRQPHGDTPCFARARKTFIKHFRGQRQKEGSLDAGIVSKRALPSLPGSLARRGSVLLGGTGGRGGRRAQRDGLRGSGRGCGRRQGGPEAKHWKIRNGSGRRGSWRLPATADSSASSSPAPREGPHLPRPPARLRGPTAAAMTKEEWGGQIPAGDRLADPASGPVLSGP